MVLQKVIIFIFMWRSECKVQYYLLLLVRIANLVRELINNTPLVNQVMIVATALTTKSLHPRLNHYQSSHIFTNEFAIPTLSNV